jgi:dipeptidyl-peptidase-4
VHPDGATKAEFREGNVWLTVPGAEPVPVTVAGGRDGLKFGQASWVYGEELGQTQAMGFSPTGRHLWYYRFDEGQVAPTWISEGLAGFAPRVRIQPFPKPGGKNPEVGLFVHDLTTGSETEIRVRPGVFDDGTGHYVYDIQWSPDGSELFFRRADRRQKVMEVCAADPANGNVRVVVAERRPESFAENRLGWTWLEALPDGGRHKGTVLYQHERNGYLNYALLDVRDGTLRELTSNRFDALGVERVDLARGRLFYMAAGEENAALRQLYVVGLDGKGNRRLTDPRFNHTVEVSAQGDWFADAYQTLEEPAGLQVVRVSDAKTVSVRKPAPWPATLPRPERIEFAASDGTRLRGTVYKPRWFDPSKKYPVLVSVYGGPLSPASMGHSESLQRPPDEVHYGFIAARFENRGTGGRGKAFRDATYGKLGIVDMDDQAAGARALVARPYVDASRIGVHGTSYGGYASLMLLLRYPDLFAAAAASSCVNDWRNYDTIYTERYMGLLEENRAGYDAGSALTYADRLRGSLLLYWGTADDNTHPENTLNMVRKFQQLGKSIDVQVGVDAGHSGVGFGRMMEFFLDRMAGERPS